MPSQCDSPPTTNDLRLTTDSMLQPQLSNKALADLCHRLAVETDAGIDIRRTWQREAESARGRLQPYFAQVRDAVANGDSLAVALARTGNVFPPLFREMALVGEQTGTLGSVFQRLESHYRRVMQAQRIFLRAIAWPMFELAFAIVVIGVLIWVMGIVADRGGRSVDILGFGLVGTRGLLIYINFLIVMGLCIAALVVAIRRGAAVDTAAAARAYATTWRGIAAWRKSHSLGWPGRCI